MVTLGGQRRQVPQAGVLPAGARVAHAGQPVRAQAQGVFGGVEGPAGQGVGGQFGAAAVGAQDETGATEIGGAGHGDAEGGDDGVGAAGNQRANERAWLVRAWHGAEVRRLVHGHDDDAPVVAEQVCHTPWLGVG